MVLEFYYWLENYYYISSKLLFYLLERGGIVNGGNPFPLLLINGGTLKLLSKIYIF